MKSHKVMKEKMKEEIVDIVMQIHNMKEYRDKALKSEFLFYGMIHLPKVFDDKFEIQEIDNSLVEYFLITDQYEMHVPWPILISDLMITMPFHGGPYDKEIWGMAFSFMQDKPIYLTHNLWTCDCVDSQFIWDVDTICCHKCNCVEDEESMEILQTKANIIKWRPKSKRIPYLHERFEYPLQEYEFDPAQLNILANDTCAVHHGAPIVIH